VLYLSGDISYDPWRRRTRTARLEELCGVKFIRELFPPLAVNATNEAAAPFLAVEAAGARVLERTPDGWPLVLQHQVGLGQVVFSTDPLELHGTAARRDRDARLYQSVLDLANVKPLPIEPHDPRLRVFRVPLAEGGQVLVAVNTDTNQPARDLTYSLPPLRRKPSDSEVDRGAMRLRFTLASARPGLVWLDGRGALRAIEAQGECRLGQELVCADQTQGIVLTLDRQDMRRSRALLLMPLRAGRVELATRVRWGQSVVQTGEIQNGRWRTFEQQALRPQAGRITVEVAERQAFSLLLVSEEIQLARWHEALGRAITDPGSLP
jgi:hypothetical protein